MKVEEKLTKLGYQLPSISKVFGSYVPAVRSGNLVFTSGQLPVAEGKVVSPGKVGTQVSLDQASQAARLCVVNALGAVKAELGNLDRIRRVIKIVGYVNSADSFTDQPKVLNAASDLLAEVFGEKGRHARAAVGVKELPMNAPVELDLLVEIQPS